MASSLFARQQQRQTSTNKESAQMGTRQKSELATAVRSIMGMVRGQDPQKFLAALCMRDPGIRATMQRWQNMTPEEICAECGVDLDWLYSLI